MKLAIAQASAAQSGKCLQRVRAISVFIKARSFQQEPREKKAIPFSSTRSQMHPCQMPTRFIVK